MMPTTIYYVDQCEGDSVIAWLNAEGAKVLGRVKQRAILFCLGNVEEFEALGTALTPDISVIPSRVALGELRTVGEIHFLKQGKTDKAFADKFRRWIKNAAIGLAASDSSVNYQLEGSVQNIARKVYAFPDGMREFAAGRYFITDEDAMRDQEALCKRLRLRGVACG